MDNTALSNEKPDHSVESVIVNLSNLIGAITEYQDISSSLTQEQESRLVSCVKTMIEISYDQISKRHGHWKEAGRAHDVYVPADTTNFREKAVIPDTQAISCWPFSGEKKYPDTIRLIVTREPSEIMILVDLLQHSPAWFFMTLTVVGLAVGSFLNVVIHRLPIMLEKQWQYESEMTLFPDKVNTPPKTYNLAIPGSQCSSCQHKIKAWENIPVISYLFLKGRCSSCKTRISLRYPVIECVSAVIALLVGWQFGVTIETLAYCILSWCLLALTMIDFDKQLLPDSITLPLVWSGLIFNSFNTIVSLEDALWGAVAGYLALWSVYWAFKLMTGKEGMGYGDFKLLAALGAWLGWKNASPGYSNVLTGWHRSCPCTYCSEVA